MTQSEGFNRIRSLSKAHWAYIVIAILIVVALVGWLRPVQEFSDHIAEPIAQSVGIGSRTCPGGWANTSARDEHLQRLSCQRDGWMVVLDAEGKFQYGFQLDTPGAKFLYDKTLIPDWPQE